MYDVIVIGGGPGGYAAAIRVRQLGAQAALVEAAELGGTCVNRGCIPSKVWLRAAYLKHWIERAGEFGLKAALGGFNPTALVERKNAVAQGIREGMTALLQKNGVTLIRGRGVLKSAREVVVEGKTYEAKKIIIATGSSPVVPEVPGLKEAALTSDELFNAGDLPASVLVYGSGPIEVEMASLLAAFGTKVTLAAPQSRILPREDHDVSQRLGQALREQGVEIITGATLAQVEKAGPGFIARLGEKTMTVARVALAARKPNTDGLGLPDLGLKLNDEGAIPVNARLETAVPGVLALGDATGGWMLSHAASAMGVTAAENAMGRQADFPARLIPRGLWTNPEAAAVGLTEEEAEKQGHEVIVGDFPYPVNGLAMLRGQVDGAVKIISEAKYGEILGVHIVGAGATEIIGEAVLALQLECTADTLAHTIRMHPTFSECMMDAARDAAAWALYLPPK
ncbi:MAG: dihydrolipoyl dehydrogenase [Thermodesulfobacteriota bacterium]